MAISRTRPLAPPSAAQRAARRGVATAAPAVLASRSPAAHSLEARALQVLRELDRKAPSAARRVFRLLDAAVAGIPPDGGTTTVLDVTWQQASEKLAKPSHSLAQAYLAWCYGLLAARYPGSVIYYAARAHAHGRVCGGVAPALPTEVAMRAAHGSP